MRSAAVARLFAAASGALAATSCGGEVSPIDASQTDTGAVIDAGPDADASPSIDADASCPAGTKRCDAGCVPLDDPAFGCAASSCEACAPPSVATQCESGACAVICASGLADCNGDPSDGCETNLSSDLQNCGQCGAVCHTACLQGQCPWECGGMYADCDGDLMLCEVDIGSDPNNCGGCGNLCAAGQTCVAGICQ